jgi:hypothetical protein
LLYNLLAKESPTVSDSLLSSVKNIPLASSNTPLDKVRPDLTSETTRAIQRALRSAAWSRFQSSTEFLAAIDDAIAAEEFSIRSGGSIRPKTFSLSWITVAIPLAAFMLITIIALFIFRQPGTNSPNPPPTGNSAVAAVSPTNNSGVAIVDATETATLTPTDRPPALGIGITLLDPSEGRTISDQDSIDFSWSWPEAVTEGEQFLLYAYSNGNPFVIDSVNVSSDDLIYRTTVPISVFSYGTGLYQWHVVLQESGNRTPLAESPRRDIFVQLPATATPNVTDTPIPTATYTPTPIPQVQVIVSSATLRKGPSIRYDRVRFLEDGDIVTVLAINEANGLWYNVITLDGVIGWLSIDVTAPIGLFDPIAIPTAAIIPPSPTPTRTPTPSPTPTITPSPTPVPSGGGGGGGPQPPQPPPTLTPPPP